MSLTIGYHQQNLHTASGARARTLRETVDRLRRESPTKPWLPGTKENPSIPNPELFTALSPALSFASTDINTSGASSSKDPNHHEPAINALSLGIPIPNIAECAIHLELLLCFAAFHRRVDNSTTLDKAFNIFPRQKTVRRYNDPAKRIRDPTFDDRRKLKWPAVLNISVERFLFWFQKLDTTMNESPRDEWSSFFPPPIDVLMVWHAVLINPSHYKRLTTSYKHIHHTPFPWAQIFEAIDLSKHFFNPPICAIAKFETMTGLTADIFQQIQQHSTYTPIAQSLAKMIEPTMPAEEATKLQANTNLTFMPGADNFRKMCEPLETASPVVKSLAAAVTRQYAFCQKMEYQLWSRSPVALETIHRSRIRYARFLKLFQLYPKTMLVPTLDIDLVWHTHQLSHEKYVSGMKTLTGTFVDHDDKIGKPTLDDGMQRTSDLYRIRFGSNYEECHCWECETLTTELEKAAATALEQGIKYEAIQEKVVKDVNYYRVAELSRREGKLLPDRYW